MSPKSIANAQIVEGTLEVVPWHDNLLVVKREATLYIGMLYCLYHGISAGYLAIRPDIRNE